MVPSRVSLLNPSPGRLVEDMGAKSVSFFCRERPVRVDRVLIEELKQVSAARQGRNVRLCLHDGPAADHHDMIILERQGRYYRPHRHAGKGECFHVIEGVLGVAIFESDGTLAEAARLGAGDIFRVGADMYHAVMPLSDPVIYHENKPGPFTGEGDSQWAPWAPDGSDAAALDTYVAGLARAFEG